MAKMVKSESASLRYKAEKRTKSECSRPKNLKRKRRRGQGRP